MPVTQGLQPPVISGSGGKEEILTKQKWKTWPENTTSAQMHAALLKPFSEQPAESLCFSLMISLYADSVLQNCRT